MLDTSKNRGLHMNTYTRMNMLMAQFCRQLLLKRVLYLRWQRWSHSPGLIYLRGGKMNSLWHLIFPSLLIWLSAGICTTIHTAILLGPLDWRLTHCDALPMTDSQPVTPRMLIVHEFYSLPQVSASCSKITCMSSITHCFSGVHSYGYFT